MYTYLYIYNMKTEKLVERKPLS